MLKLSKPILLAFLISFQTDCYCQNIIAVSRAIRPTTITRTLILPESYYRPLYNLHNLYQNSSLTSYNGNLQLVINKQIYQKIYLHPRDIYGPYNYDRVVAKISREIYRDKIWKNLNKTTSYNGVHHLIMKSTIELIYNDLKKSGIEVSLSEMQNNAPSIFHPHHGNPKYNYIFHDYEHQYELYKKHGMKILVLHQLTEIDLVNQLEGLEHFSEEYINGVLKEAELWCKYYNMNW